MNAVLQEPTKHKLSVEDYYRMAEVGILARDARTELINGEIIDMAPPGKLHAGIVSRLTRLLVYATGDKAIVRVQDPVTIENFSEPQPDIAVVKPRADSYMHSETHPTAHDIHLLIEVSVSSVKHDRDTKIPLYAHHGVPAVLLILPEDSKIWYYTDLDEGQYGQQVELTDLSRVPIGTLADCWMDLSRLLE